MRCVTYRTALLIFTWPRDERDLDMILLVFGSDFGRMHFFSVYLLFAPCQYLSTVASSLPFLVGGCSFRYDSTLQCTIILFCLSISPRNTYHTLRHFHIQAQRPSLYLI